MNTCIACGNNILLSIQNPEPSPLVALNLPSSESEAINALRLPMTFKVCGICGHVFNTDFQYAKVPYSGDSNRMYNSGEVWMRHMKSLAYDIIEHDHILHSGQVIDIGCGDSQFLQVLKDECPSVRCVGYEPGVDGARKRDFTIIQDYFIPERDLRRHSPSMLICRHVIEHMEAPRDFISQVAFWSGYYAIAPIFVVEVPCIDKAMKTGRMSDFLYEHVSNFTKASLTALFTGAGFELLNIYKTYEDEVLVGIFKPKSNLIGETLRQSNNFTMLARSSVTTVCEQLENMSNVVLWGGTGKSAAFINNHKLDAAHYPSVVDSDKNKWGYYVPGTGQQIQDPETIKQCADPTIVITTPWRAEDIYRDITTRGLSYKRLVVLQDGKLQDYESDIA